jgi:hypothetical protein
VEALRRLAELAAAVGDTGLGNDAARRFGAARQSLERRFWMPAAGRFAFAILDGDRLNENLTVWPATAMSWHLFDEERGQAMAAELARATLATDWGARTLAAESPLYDPLHYNNGTVWPFVTGFLALAQYRYHNPYAGREQLDAVARTFHVWGLGRNPEVFSGASFEPLETAVPQQFFATSMYLHPLVRGALGIEADAPRGVLTIAPHLFTTPGRLRVSRVRAGGVVLDVTLDIGDTAFVARVSRVAGGEPLTLRFEPALAPGSAVREVRAAGRSVPFRTRETGRDVHVVFDATLPAAGALEVTVRHAPGWRLEVEQPAVERGARSRRLKVLEARLEGPGLAVSFEGLAGARYPVLVHRGNRGVMRQVLDLPNVGGDDRDGYVRLRRVFP